MQYVIPLVDGKYESGDSSITTSGVFNSAEKHVLMVAVNGAPTDGRITIEYRRSGDTRWRYVDYTDLTEVEPQKVFFTGYADSYRFIVEGADGTGSVIVSDTELGEAATPYGLYGNTNGMTPEEIGGAIELFSSFENTGAWTTATDYTINQLWSDGGNWYLVLEDYTSGASAAADIAGGTVAQYEPSGRTWQVYSIAQMEALTPLKEGQAVYLSSGGRSGTFHWDGSDLSTEVAADTLQGVYIAPSSDATGASGAWVRDRNDWYELAWFGVEYDDSDESSTLQQAIDTVSSLYSTRNATDLFVSKNLRARGVNIKSNVVVCGAGMFSTSIKAPDGWSVGNVLESNLFDTYKYAASDANTPYNCGVRNITIDGNHENYTGTASDTAGLCLRMAAVRPVMRNIRIIGGPGIGLHTGLSGVTRTATDWYRSQTKLGDIGGIKVFGCLNDGVVWDGASDQFIDEIEVGVCGWPDTTFSVSRPSLIEPSRRVCGISINTAVEFGWLHSFGIREGYAVIVGRPSYGVGTIRFKAETVICESSNCGLWTREGARYQIANLDIHNNYGVDGTPQWLDDGTGLQGTVSNLEVVSSANSNGQDIVRLVGDSKCVSRAHINGAGVNNDAVVIGGFNNSINADVTGSSTRGVKILSSATQWSVNATVGACGVGAELEVGAGDPLESNIVALFGNTTDFVGFSAMSTEYRKQVKLESKSGINKKSRGYSGTSVDVSADSTTLKTVNIPINGLFAPNPDEITLSVEYVSGGSPDYSQLTIAGTTITSSQIQAYLRFDAVGSGVVKVSAHVG